MTPTVPSAVICSLTVDDMQRARLIRHCLWLKLAFCEVPRLQIVLICLVAGLFISQQLDGEAKDEEWREERSALEAIYAEDVSFPSASCTVLRMKAEPGAIEQVMMQVCLKFANTGSHADCLQCVV